MSFNNNNNNNSTVSKSWTPWQVPPDDTKGGQKSFVTPPINYRVPSIDGRLRYCEFKNFEGFPRHYICSHHEYCCSLGCCVSTAFAFWQLWYFWLLLLFLLLTCSGGGWWFRWRQGITGTLPSSRSPHTLGRRGRDGQLIRNTTHHRVYPDHGHYPAHPQYPLPDDVDKDPPSYNEVIRHLSNFPPATSSIVASHRTQPGADCWLVAAPPPPYEMIQDLKRKEEQLAREIMEEERVQQHVPSTATSPAQQQQQQHQVQQDQEHVLPRRQERLSARDRLRSMLRLSSASKTSLLSTTSTTSTSTTEPTTTTHIDDSTSNPPPFFISPTSLPPSDTDIPGSMAESTSFQPFITQTQLQPNSPFPLPTNNPQITQVVTPTISNSNQTNNINNNNNNNDNDNNDNAELQDSFRPFIISSNNMQSRHHPISESTMIPSREGYASSGSISPSHSDTSSAFITSPSASSTFSESGRRLPLSSSEDVDPYSKLEGPRPVSSISLITRRMSLGAGGSGGGEGLPSDVRRPSTSISTLSRPATSISGKSLPIPPDLERRPSIPGALIEDEEKETACENNQSSYK